MNHLSAQGKAIHIYSTRALKDSIEKVIAPGSWLLFTVHWPTTDPNGLAEVLVISYPSSLMFYI